jgi:hypothetical protein
MWKRPLTSRGRTGGRRGGWPAARTSRCSGAEQPAAIAWSPGPARRSSRLAHTHISKETRRHPTQHTHTPTEPRNPAPPDPTHTNPRHTHTHTDTDTPRNRQHHMDCIRSHHTGTVVAFLPTLVQAGNKCRYAWGRGRGAGGMGLTEVEVWAGAAAGAAVP